MMEKNLYSLIKRAQKNDSEAINELINTFDPKIKKSLRKTHVNNKKDLEQEIKEKLINIFKSYNINKLPSIQDEFSKTNC